MKHPVGCPFCSSPVVRHHKPEFTAHLAFRESTCRQCNRSWETFWRLTDIKEVVYVPDPE
jgi:transposase-like protein